MFTFFPEGFALSTHRHAQERPQCRPARTGSILSPWSGARRRALSGLPICLAAMLWLAASAQAQMLRLKSMELDPTNGANAIADAVAAGQPAADLLAAASLPPAAGELKLLIVQWPSALQPTDLEPIVDGGGKPILPIPDHAWLVAVPESFDVSALTARPAGLQRAARWAGSLAPGWKLDPAVAGEVQAWADAGGGKGAAAQTRQYYVQLADNGADSRLLRMIGMRGAKPRLFAKRDNFQTWEVALTPDLVRDLARENAVFWIEPVYERKMYGERGASIGAGLVDTGAACLNVSGTRYAEWLEQVVLNGDGVTVQVMDDGLARGDASNNPGTAHADIVGRIAGIFNATSDLTGNSRDGHGHINASIIMGQPLAGGGRVDAGGFLLGQGVAPQARVYATKIFKNGGLFDIQTNTFTGLVRLAYQAGSRISSNSWGADVNGAYTIDAQEFDALTRDADNQTVGDQQMTFVFAAGNAGPGQQSIGSPATAKNVIAVGAGENCDQGILDGSGMGPNDANNLRDMAVFSSRGPTRDGRFGTTVIAPGVHVTGAASDEPTYNGSGVSGRASSSLEPGEPATATRYYPAFQTDYTWSSGTSHSTPLTAGGAALLYQYFLRENGVAPSPALLRAALIAGAVDTVGGNTNTSPPGTMPNVPNIQAGWGRVNVAPIVDGESAPYVVDQTEILKVSGESREFLIQIREPAQPMKVVLTWTDAYGSASASKTLINDLDLTVKREGTGETWLGNVFEGGYSVTGGEADRLNTVESVFLESPTQDLYRVMVTAHEILGNGVPSTSGLDQDFALLVLNGNSQGGVGVIGFGREVVRCDSVLTVTVSDGDLRGDGQAEVTVRNPDNGDMEAVTLTEAGEETGIFSGTIMLVSDGAAEEDDQRLTVQDGDTIEGTYLDQATEEGEEDRIATVQATVDCVAPELTGHAVAKITESEIHLEFETDELVQLSVDFGEACGALTGSVVLNDFSTMHSLALTDLTQCTAYYYQVTLTDRAGNTTVYDNNGNCFQVFTLVVDPVFEDTMDPEADPDWFHVAARGFDDWAVVSSGLSRSPANSWFTADVPTIKDASLWAPALVVQEGARLRFWHTYRLESSGIGTTGYDGAVVELSTNDGNDWIDLGPQIVEGGYNSTISTIYQSPIAGRPAWSGGSLEEMTRVIVDLSPWVGQRVRLRFRIACDNSFGSTGWFIDDVAVENVVSCVGTIAQVIFDGEYVSARNERIRFRVSDRDLSSLRDQEPGIFRIARVGELTGPRISPEDFQRIEDRGVWEGFLPIVPLGTSGRYLVANTLEVGEGEIVRLLYEDLDPLDEVTVTVVYDDGILDSTPPALMSASVEKVQARNADARVTASEPILARIEYGLTCGGFEQSVEVTEPETNLLLALTGLLPCSVYYYHVTLTDRAGNESVFTNEEQCYGFKTQAEIAIAESMNPNPFDREWSQLVTEAGSFWRNFSSTHAHSPQYVLRCAASSFVADARLMSPEFDIPGQSNLSFWHTYAFEEGFDGGVIEITTDEGQTWTDLGPYIVGDGYNSMISSDFGNPLAGREAWSGGTLGAMTQVVIDTSVFVGEARKVRFRLGSDSTLAASTSRWEIDDYTITSYSDCGGEDFPFQPGGLVLTGNPATVDFRNPPALGWGETPGSTSYEVFLGTSPDKMVKIQETSTNVGLLPVSPPLKADTIYYWKVLALNALGATASGISQFRTVAVDPGQIARQVIEIPGGLTVVEQQAVDYDEDGRVTIRDLIEAVNRKKQ
jgi:subtilisin family serine protease